VSLEKELKLLLRLPELSAGENGGDVSDNLGSRPSAAFTVTGRKRPCRSERVPGRDDLLYLGDMTSGEDPIVYPTVKVLESFSQKYREDPFADQLGETVLRS
jgi:hypothetical protein